MSAADGCRCDGIENQPGVPVEELLVGRIPEGAGGKLLQDLSRDGEFGGVQGPDECLDRGPLFLSGNVAKGLLAVSPHGVGVVEASHHLWK